MGGRVKSRWKPDRLIFEDDTALVVDLEEGGKEKGSE